MRQIQEIDPNFHVNTILPKEYLFYDVRESPFQLYGLSINEERSYCRLPLSLLPQCNENLQHLSFHTAGACVRFSTDSPQLCVLWELTEEGNMAHFTACGQSGLELFEETELGTEQIANIIPQLNQGKGNLLQQKSVKSLRKGMRHYVLYLPLYNGIKQLLLGFAPNAKIAKGRTPKIDKPLVFYGSSITQGGCASKAGSCYTTILSRRLDAAQVNLGFSGNARGEACMAKYIATLSMSAFIMDYDHNAPSAKYLMETHEPFYEIIRKTQPDLPILFVSKPDFDANIENNRERRNVILRTYARALAKGDKQIYFIDGEQFFGAKDRDLCTVDGCHPTDIGFLRMADTMEPVLRHILYPAIS